MAYYSIFPEKDATIYSHPNREKLNTGGDEILEIVKEKGNSDQRYYPSRVLIQFKSEEIKEIITDKMVNGNGATLGPTFFSVSDPTALNNFVNVSLELFTAQHKNLANVINLEAYAVSQSWHEGSGRFSNLPTSSNGCSWVFRDNDVTKTQWTTGSTTTTGLTFGSSSIHINELPSGSQMELTINGIDYVPVISASLFDNNNSEFFVEISSSTDIFGTNLANIINASSSLNNVTASYNTSSATPANTLILSGSSVGTNIIITTSSIDGNNQAVFTSSIGNYSVQGATTSATPAFNPGTSGSIIASGITEGGGVWFRGVGYQATQQFKNGDKLDTSFNVTSIIQKFSASLFAGTTYPDGIENNGFIIKQPDSVETNTSSSTGEMQYFSTDTHTIYPPKLTFKWQDAVYSTGGGTVLNSGDIFLSLYNNKAEFQRKSKQRFRITTRKRYPDRTFVTSSNYLNIQYLPQTSYYSVRDAETDEVIIPFDTKFTKLSADSDGMFFDLFMEGLQPERYYKLQFRVDNNDGVNIYDEDYSFKVVR